MVNGHDLSLVVTFTLLQAENLVLFYSVKRQSIFFIGPGWAYIFKNFSYWTSKVGPNAAKIEVSCVGLVILNY